MRPLFVLALLALFTGCFSATTPVESAAISEEPTEGAAPEAEPTVVEGVALVPREFPFAFEGRTGTNACVPAGPNSCVGLPAGGTPSENTFNELLYEGTPKSVEATLVWEAATPATEDMYLAVFAVRSCGDQCFEWGGDSFYEVVSGPSPLTLSATGVFLGENETLQVKVGLERKVPYTPGVFFFYSIDQEFTIEGKVHALVPADDTL